MGKPFHHKLVRQSHTMRRHIISLLPIDTHFMYFASDFLGISTAELFRRIIFTMRESYIKAGVYSYPRDPMSLLVDVQAQAKARRYGKRRINQLGVNANPTLDNPGPGASKS